MSFSVPSRRLTPFVSSTEAEEREGRACEDRALDARAWDARAWDARALFGGFMRIPQGFGPTEQRPRGSLLAAFVQINSDEIMYYGRDAGQSSAIGITKP